MEAAEEYDMYDDLFDNSGTGNPIIRTSIQEMEEKIELLTNGEKEMRAKVEELQKQNEMLGKQKEVLIRNISCLFKTAQMEIARKDKQIKKLNEENMQLKLKNPQRGPSNVWKSVTGKDGGKELEKTSFRTEIQSATIDSQHPSNDNDRELIKSENNWQPSQDEYGSAEEHMENADQYHQKKQQNYIGRTDAFRERRKRYYCGARISADHCNSYQGEKMASHDSNLALHAERRDRHFNCEGRKERRFSNRKRENDIE